MKPACLTEDDFPKPTPRPQIACRLNGIFSNPLRHVLACLELPSLVKARLWQRRTGGTPSELCVCRGGHVRLGAQHRSTYDPEKDEDWSKMDAVERGLWIVANEKSGVDAAVISDVLRELCELAEGLRDLLHENDE